MDARYQVSQAVYTDPMASSGGYEVVAASPGLEAQERAILRNSPGISDYLSSEADPGPFFSLFELPTGRWALVRRFVAGRRRGVNRVVVHMLCVPPELLEHYEGNGALFVLCCRYAGRDGRPLALAPLSKAASTAATPTLDELVAAPQPPSALRDLLIERIAFRVEETLAATGWDPETLAGRLAAILAKLADGQRIMLPQVLAFEHLLFLTLLLLPGTDQKACAWTTHFAPGVPIPFRLALSADPTAAIQQHRDPGQWCEWSEIERCLLTDRHGQESPLVVLGRAASRSRERLLQILDGYASYGLSLLGDTAQFARWLFYVERGAQTREGFASLQELASYLARYRGAGSSGSAVPHTVDPWRGRDEMLQTCLATAARALENDEPDLEQLYSTVPENVLDMMTEVADGRADLMATLGAVRLQASGPLSKSELLAAGAAMALVQRRREARWDGSTARLLELLEKLPWRREVRYADLLLADLALAMARAGDRGDGAPAPAIVEVVGIEEALHRVRRQLLPPPSDLQAVVQVLEAMLAAGEATEPEQAADWIEGELLPRIDGEKPEIPAELIGRCLAALEARPVALRGALDSSSATVRAAAAEQLSDWALDRPELARHCLAGLSPATAPGALDQLPALDLLTRRLADAGVGVLEWLPFALAAARRLDHQQASPRAARLLRDTLIRTRLRPEEETPIGRAVVQPVAEAVRAASAGVGHRTLLELAWPAMATDRQTAEALLDVARSLSSWEPTRAVPWYEELRIITTGREPEDPEADRLLASAWCRLARTDLSRLPNPEGWGSTLERLGPSRQGSLVEAWADRIPGLDGAGAEGSLLDAFERWTPKDVRQRFRLRSALLAREVATGSLDRERAANRIELLRRRLSLPSASLIEALDRVLGVGAGHPRALAWLELLRSHRLSQTLQHFLESHLTGILKHGALTVTNAESLPDPTAFEGQPSLLQLAAFLGEGWRLEQERIDVHGPLGEENRYSRALASFLERSLVGRLADAVSTALEAAGWRYSAWLIERDGSSADGLRETLESFGRPYCQMLMPLLEEIGTTVQTTRGRR